MHGVNHKINNTHKLTPTHLSRWWVPKTWMSRGRCFIKQTITRAHQRRAARTPSSRTYTQAPVCWNTPSLDTQGHMKQKALPSGTARALGDGGWGSWGGGGACAPGLGSFVSIAVSYVEKIVLLDFWIAATMLLNYKRNKWSHIQNKTVLHIKVEFLRNIENQKWKQHFKGLEIILCIFLIFRKMPSIFSTFTKQRRPKIIFAFRPCRCVSFLPITPTSLRLRIGEAVRESAGDTRTLTWKHDPRNSYCLTCWHTRAHSLTHTRAVQ